MQICLLCTSCVSCMVPYDKSREKKTNVFLLYNREDNNKQED